MITLGKRTMSEVGKMGKTRDSWGVSTTFASITVLPL
jgi:hypothetical protein